MIEALAGGNGQVPQLPFGRFFGRPTAEREVGGFRLAQFTPTLANREVAAHRHDEAHFVFVLHGRYETSAALPPDGSPPRIVYSPPGTSHRDCFVAATDLATAAFATLSIDSRTMAEVETESKLPAKGVCVGESAVPLVRRLLSEARGVDALSTWVSEELCLELLQRTGATRASTGSAVPAWLSRARDLLRDSAFSFGPRSVGEIARELGVHRVHLARRFRAAFGLSPGEYVRRCRLDRAQRMLVGSAAPLAEIAAAAGFADQSHFSNAFRRQFGASPRAFRRISG